MGCLLVAVHCGTHGGSREAWEGARPGVRPRVSVMGVEWESGPPQTTQEQAAWLQLVQTDTGAGASHCTALQAARLRVGHSSRITIRHLGVFLSLRFTHGSEYSPRTTDWSRRQRGHAGRGER